MNRRACRVLITSIFLLAGISANAQMDEYSIKAAFLYNFSKYVEWPETTFPAPTAPFVICIAGDDPFEGRLDQVIAGKTAGNGRSLKIRRLTSLDNGTLRKCQMIFVSKSDRPNAAAILDVVKGMPVFTVADFSPFAESGGVANLRIEGTKVQVDLNMAAATRANLKVSGKLQQVANPVN
jgi:hypothetical protein